MRFYEKYKLGELKSEKSVEILNFIETVRIVSEISEIIFIQELFTQQY